MILPAVKFTGNRRSALTALALALLLVTGSIILMRMGNGTGPSPAARPSAAGLGRPSPRAGLQRKKTARPGPQTSTAERTHGLGFSTGDTLRYRFERQRNLTLAASAGPGTKENGSENPAVTLIDSTSGILSIRAYEELPAGWVLGFEFSEVKTAVEAVDASELEPADELSEEMNAEVLVLLAPSGKFRKLVFPSSTGTNARNSIRNLMALFQVVLPEDKSRTEWQVEEEDTTGTYLASYRKNRNAKGTSIIKSRLNYTSIQSGEPNGDSLEDLARTGGQTKILLDPCPLLIEGTREMAISLEGFAQGVSSQTWYRFEREELHRGNYHPEAKRVIELLSSTGTTLRAQARSRGEGLALESGLPDTVEILRNIPTVISDRGIESAAATTVMVQLVDAIKRDDQAVTGVLDRLSESSCGEDESSLLIGALGAAGTAAAQDGLEELISSEKSPVQRREAALFAFAQVESPGAGIDETLQNLYEEKGNLSNTSLLLLGAVGSRVKSSDPERFEMTAAYLLEAYRAGDKHGERAAVLESLGNLGLEETPPEIAGAYTDASERIRRAAVRSLRRTYDNAAEGILLHAFESDPSESVRAAAAKTLAEFPHEADDEFLRQALPQEDSEHVRRDLLAGLSRRERFDDGARDLVDWIAGNDPSGDIREYAENLLR
ncbi:MAG: HEAT repeat domain-containing protein [Planctomycetota bacterium]